MKGGQLLTNRCAAMRVEVKTQKPVLRKNVSDYPQYSELEVATAAIGQPLAVSR